MQTNDYEATMAAFSSFINEENLNVQQSLATKIREIRENAVVA